MELKELMANQEVPNNLEPYIGDVCTTKEEYQDSGFSKPMVLDINAKVYVDKEQTMYVSFLEDGDKIGFFTQGKSFLEKTRNKQNKFKVTRHVDLSQIGGERMENNFSPEALREKLKAQAAKGTDSIPMPTPGAQTPMNTFGGTATGETHHNSNSNKEANEAYREMITAQTKGVELSNAVALMAFNKMYGSCIGHITSNDEQIGFGYKAEDLKDSDGNYKTVPSASPEVKAEALKGGTPAVADRERRYSLRLKDQKPGKHVGTVLGVPTGGFVDILSLRGSSNEEVKYDGKNTDIKYVLSDVDKTIVLVSLYFGGVIKESKETFGQYASSMIVDSKPATKINKTTNVAETVHRMRLKPANKRPSLIVPGAYLPIKTYETVNITESVQEDKIADLNKGQFSKLFKVTKGSAYTIASRLSPEFEQLVSRDTKTGLITSKYFSNNSDRKLPEVTSYYDKTKKLDVINIPLHKEVPKKSKPEEMRLELVSYSVLDKKCETDPAYAAKTSLNSGKFTSFLQACGGVITADSLRGLVKAKSNSGQVISEDMSRKFVMKYITERGGLSTQVDGISNKVSLDDIIEVVSTAKLGNQ